MKNRKTGVCTSVFLYNKNIHNQKIKCGNNHKIIDKMWINKVKNK